MYNIKFTDHMDRIYNKFNTLHTKPNIFTNYIY